MYVGVITTRIAAKFVDELISLGTLTLLVHSIPEGHIIQAFGLMFALRRLVNRVNGRSRRTSTPAVRMKLEGRTPSS
jgi:hypothetical protein